MVLTQIMQRGEVAQREVDTLLSSVQQSTRQSTDAPDCSEMGCISMLPWKLQRVAHGTAVWNMKLGFGPRGPHLGAPQGRLQAAIGTGRRASG